MFRCTDRVSSLLRTTVKSGSDGRFIVSPRNRLKPYAENVSLVSGDRALKQGIDIWGETPATIDVMEALKEQFDPSRVLNPGRFAGFI